MRREDDPEAGDRNWKAANLGIKDDWWKNGQVEQTKINKREAYHYQYANPSNLFDDYTKNSSHYASSNLLNISGSSKNYQKLKLLSPDQSIL